MSNQLAEQKAKSSLRAMLAKPDVQEGIGNALGSWMPKEEFIAQVLISLSDPKLDQCSVRSKYEAAHLCASLALLPSLQQAALIPRKRKIAENQYEKVVDVMPQWQGYKSMMERHPDVLSVKAVLVHVKDSYSFNTATQQIDSHNYDPFDDKRVFKTLDDIKGGYVVVTWRDGRPRDFHFVKRETIRKARACADTKNVWDNWLEEQALKTLYRNAYARRVVPIDTLVNKRLEAITQQEDRVMGNDPNRLDVEQPQRIAQQPQSRTEMLADRFRGQQTPQPALEPPRETYYEEPQEQELEAEPVEAKKQQPAKQSTKKKQQTKKKQEGPPEVPDSLQDWAREVHSCEEPGDVKSLWRTRIDKGAQSEEEHVAGTALRDWKLAELERKSKDAKQGSLIDD